MERRKLISEMENNLKAFGAMLSNLNKTDNLVLGGSYAMLLHGIHLKRIPEDVDIIIYNATTEQLDTIKLLGDFNQLSDGPDFDPGYDQTVFKFKAKKNSKPYTLDILLENSPVPNNLLWYVNGKIKVRIQDITKIVEAKAGYKRSKDFEDLIDLKNLNFNPKS